MVELVDTLDLGSSALWACRFDPCSRYFYFSQLDSHMGIDNVVITSRLTIGS